VSVQLKSVFERLNYWATKNPDRLLYSFLNMSGEPVESFSYEAFLERTNVIAAHLLSEYKCQPADRLLLCFPPGLEMMCAFFASVRAGLIPVPMYPPNSHGFEAALYKMIHIAKDCEASGVLTSRDYYGSLKSRLAKAGPSVSLPEKDYLANLKWIVTEDLKQSPAGETVTNEAHDILFIQYTSGSTSNPKGVIVTHGNVLHNCDLVMDHPNPVAVSWLPQYHDMGLIGCYLYTALSGGTTYGFSPVVFIQRPAVWLDAIKRYEASASSAPNFAFEYCLRPGRLSEESLANADLSSLRLLIAAAEPVKPATYLRFLQTFEPYGLKPECFFVAYGLAENTLAVSNCGRSILSVNKKALSLRKVRVTSEVSEIAAAIRIVSCGKPLGDLVVKIVDPDTLAALQEGNIGEIWVDGQSKCLGYWNNPELTQETFHARIVGENQSGDGYLRTGDLGFLHKDELYVCGRIKDMIIIRGQNYYPQDIESIVEDASDLIRKTCVAAFEIDEGQGPELAVVAEVKNANAIPDPRDLVTAIRRYLNLETALVALVAPRAIPKTSSGKIMRQVAKQIWLNGKFSVLCKVSRDSDSGVGAQSKGRTGRFDELKSRYCLQGDETQSLIEVGVDSLDLVLLLHEITEMLKESGADVLADQVDVALIQHIKVSELFRLAELFEASPETALLHVRYSLADLREEHRRREHAMMCNDRQLLFQPPHGFEPSKQRGAGGILLTGGTGFVGPFLLKSLLEQTDEQIYVLMRAADASRAGERLRAALRSTGPLAAPLERVLSKRVVPICGDLALPNLGLTRERWQFLANGISTIYHNGAMVNYVFNYEAVRAANVLGTNEVLRLAFEGPAKTFNYMSTTFIFGWTVKETLYETDSNQNMELLDFGYSQSKWVAEQVVIDAARRGLMTRVFRPSLVSPSIVGGGDNLDIAIRLLAFMINHGIGVETLNQVSFVPADIVANNVVAISNDPATLNGTYHVTQDEYANMMDVTNMITELTGRRFQLFKLAEFVPEVIRRSTKEDLLFPLLDFLIGSVDRIASMEFKRYDSSQYQRARNSCRAGMQDASLEDTVCGILRFMQSKGIIRLQEVRRLMRTGSVDDVSRGSTARGRAPIMRPVAG
jgi:thioester reductase-like protein